MTDALTTETDSSINDSQLSRFLTIRVKGRLLGLSISDIDDIIRDYPITAIPLAPSFITGALNLRGRVCTVADLALCLQLSEPVDTTPEPLNTPSKANTSNEHEASSSQEEGLASEKETLSNAEETESDENISKEASAILAKIQDADGSKAGPFYVIVHYGKDLYAIAVDHVEDEIHIPANKIMRPPDNLPTHHQECAIGVLQQEGELLLLLDTTIILKGLQ